jgi:single-stranded-DNA-specific exonuclease
VDQIFAQRAFDETIVKELEKSGKHPVLARILAARGVLPDEVNKFTLNDLLPWNGPNGLKGIVEAANLLADAVQTGKKIVIVADYDADGATACAVGIRALRAMGAIVDFAVPDRMTMGYGLSIDVVKFAARMKPDLLLTVDNGISSHDGVDYANELGIPVIVTDHHLAGETLPAAVAIVNPNQPGCRFPSKNIAGVGVSFYLMLALRHVLKEREHFHTRPIPNMANLLDLVALGTVADVVKLDHNNRILVANGLKHLVGNSCNKGIAALIQVSERDRLKIKSIDLGFLIGPRLNAAGRMADMSAGIRCLATDNSDEAMELATELDQLNRERRKVEASMCEDVEPLLQNIKSIGQYTLALYDPQWHTGVIGIVASRVKDKVHRPVITFAPGIASGQIRGSGRSIVGFHLRDALERINYLHPGLMQSFGGHAMAAGLTIEEARLGEFRTAFEKVGQEWLTPDLLTNKFEHDGPLDVSSMNVAVIETVTNETWGQGFPTPVFEGEFKVARQRILKEKHSKLTLSQNGKQIDGIFFGFADSLPEQIKAFFSVEINEWMGAKTVQISIKRVLAQTRA